jgi:hypothetical protein
MNVNAKPKTTETITKTLAITFFILLIFRWLINDYTTKIRPFFDLPKGFENIFTFFKDLYVSTL